MKLRQSRWVPIALLAWGGVLLLNPLPYVSELPAATVVPGWATDPTPVRQPKGVPAYSVAGFTYGCNDCHAIIPSPAETDRTLVQHTEIRLRHGLNTRCFNCHHRTDREAWVDDFGEPIPWADPPRLCGKCHGPVYRDWQAGSHGRTNGSWDPARGTQTRRKCIECHDPHTPPFPPLEPAPGPNTFRMGPQESQDEGPARNPLRVDALPRRETRGD